MPTFARQLNQTRNEWGLVAFIAILCAILTVLQYRWTGEISRAELARLRAGLADQVERLRRDFNSEFASSSTALLPSTAELDESGFEAAHLKRFREWTAGNPRPLFRRIAVAVPTREDLQVFLLDQKEGRLLSSTWPAEWNGLRDNLARKRPGGGGSPPFLDPAGVLSELPLFGMPRQRGGGPEREWLILELDLAYARTHWLPELIRKHLNPDDRNLNGVTVKTVSSPSTIICTAWERESEKSDEPFSTTLNPSLRAGGHREGRERDGRWVLEARPHRGALEAVVSASRQRNLAVAVMLNGLILAAGCVLVYHTRRSRQLAEAQMDFVANVSHEFRTPLTVIRGAGHNLLRGVVHERSQIEQYSQLIIQHAENLTGMMEQLLELAGARGTKVLPAREPAALAEVLQDAVAVARHDTQAAQCEVELRIEPDLPRLTADAPALRRTFQNLITNAAKHGGQGKWIGITAVCDKESDPPVIEVRFADRGRGIPPNELTDIFEPFFRGAAARENQIRGSGLGLSLVREIIEAHGGGISASSPPEGGATFVVRLPAAHAAPPA